VIQITRIRLLGQGGFDLPGAWTSDQCFDLVKRLGGDSRVLYVNLLSYDDEGLLVENDRAAMMPGTPAMLSAHAQWAQRSKDLGEIGATPPPRFVYEPIGVVLPDPRERTGPAPDAWRARPTLLPAPLRAKPRWRLSKFSRLLLIHCLLVFSAGFALGWLLS
jgi:hypothetical protein